MFRKDASAYLHELMRTDAAVGQFTTALTKDETWNLEGHKAGNVPCAHMCSHECSHVCSHVCSHMSHMSRIPVRCHSQRIRR